MKDSPTRIRREALLIIVSVLEEGKWANKLLIPSLFRLNNREDRALLTELVYGTIKMKLYLDWVLNKILINYRMEDLTPWIRNILRLTAYEILFTRIPPYASVSEGVKLAKRYGHRGTASLVNAVLRRLDRERPQPDEPWIRYSHPEWLYRRWIERWGEERTIQIMEHNNKPPLIYIRVNTLLTSKGDVISFLEEKGVEYRDIPFPDETLRVSIPPQDLDLPLHWYYAQDLSSQVVSYLLSPSPGDLIYDFASAPGGKSTHLASLMKNRGFILGLEYYQSRARDLMENVKRMGAEIIRVVIGDSRKIILRKKADKILLDVPCSGLGTLRRRPELRWRMKEERIGELQTLEWEILENASQYLKKGGILVYATCTTEPEENEEQIKKFLQRNRDFEIECAQNFIPEQFTESPFLKVDGVKHDCDFSFAARLKRI
jgi:16S rRNA (cytosine967-C5)-methyltransferase